MNILYDDSCTPWQTPNLQHQPINYLQKPPGLNIYTLHSNYQSSSHYSTPLKQSKYYFVQNNKINSKKNLRKNHQKQLPNHHQKLLTKSHQSQHFQRIIHNKSSSLINQQKPKYETLNTLINNSIKRKCLKKKIQRTKQLVQKNQHRKSQLKIKSKQQSELQQSLNRLLSLTKSTSHHNLSNNNNIFSSTRVDIFQMKKQVNSNSKNKNASIENKQKIKSEIQSLKQNFLQSKTNINYLKKRINNKTFYKHFKYEKSMNLPKIQILDWDKSDL